MKTDIKSQKVVIYFIVLGILFSLGISVFRSYQKEADNSSVILTTNVPINYSECLQDSSSEHNKATCSIFYSVNNPDTNKCLEMGGCNPAGADGPDGCIIEFFNPNLKYPDNYQDCKDMYGDEYARSVDAFDGLCSFFLNSSCSGDKNTSRMVLDKCPKDFKLNTYKNYATCEKVFGKEEL